MSPDHLTDGLCLLPSVGDCPAILLFEGNIGQTIPLNVVEVKAFFGGLNGSKKFFDLGDKLLIAF